MCPQSAGRARYSTPRGGVHGRVRARVCAFVRRAEAKRTGGERQLRTRTNTAGWRATCPTQREKDAKLRFFRFDTEVKQQLD